MQSRNSSPLSLYMYWPEDERSGIRTPREIQKIANKGHWCGYALQLRSDFLKPEFTLIPITWITGIPTPLWNSQRKVASVVRTVCEFALVPFALTILRGLLRKKSLQDLPTCLYLSLMVSLTGICSCLALLALRLLDNGVSLVFVFPMMFSRVNNGIRSVFAQKRT